MAKFRGSINEFEADFFQVDSLGVSEHGLSEQDELLFGSNATSFDDDEVISDNSVVWEASHGSDVLFGDIDCGGGVVFVAVTLALTHPVYLFVDFGSVVVAQLTRSRHRPCYSRRMPSADTPNFSVASVRFLLQMSDSESFHDSCESFTFGDSDHIDVLIFIEYLVNFQILVEEAHSEFDFFSGVFSSVDLDFEDVILFLAEIPHEVLLGMGDDPNHTAVSFDSAELGFEFLGFFGQLGVVVGESFLLGVHPILVESSHCANVEVIGPNRSQSSEATGSFDVSYQTDDLEWRGFDHSDCFNFLFLVELGFGSGDVSEDMCHSCFEASECGEVTGIGFVVFGEGSDSATVVAGPSAGYES